jgi:peptide/nickel transport system substrate-binding protein
VAAALPAGLLVNQAQAATPKRGGDLRIGFSQGSTTDSLDPAQTTSNFSTLLFYSYLDQLTEISSTGELVPLLAESWESSNGALEWTFALRKGIEFHSGKTLNADDVIVSIDRHRGESPSSLNTFANKIEEMKKDGDHRVHFRLTEAMADFPYILGAPQLGILPVNDGKADISGIGTGGYTMKEFDAGVRAKLERNPNYFREKLTHFDTAEVLVISDAASRQNALVTGEIHVIDRVDLKTIHLLEEDQSVNILDKTGSLFYTLPMKTDTAPFDNNDVRLALKYAIDREEILQKSASRLWRAGQRQSNFTSVPLFRLNDRAACLRPGQSQISLKAGGHGRS